MFYYDEIESTKNFVVIINDHVVRKHMFKVRIRNNVIRINRINNDNDEDNCLKSI